MFNRFSPESARPSSYANPDISPVAKSSQFDIPLQPAGEQSKLIRQELIDAKVRLHRKLIDDLNLSLLERLSKDELRRQVSDIVADYVRSERILLNSKELELFITEVFD